mmetsp:Transcript_31541/g.38329  ORF Transcript_31541/g.38329 Transcript_31541/m.38329 type:complete len:169 (+) Transcript_31541:84-590(+)|eukprot:CAMPEP_0194358006 /NCGR_PEP_ID=MMETSP0174-20130528/5381_1 /TAXON_ID=216777 /ORGANISM="Proboscia alata, Strain PI-D3" /LENGTH=168 /DNA_ID=CAMNT_0039128225 /DNA_START=81 /DNA_END=587 /DNA_ORIENTATION=-
MSTKLIKKLIRQKANDNDSCIRDKKSSITSTKAKSTISFGSHVTRQLHPKHQIKSLSQLQQEAIDNQVKSMLQVDRATQKTNRVVNDIVREKQCYIRKERKNIKKRKIEDDGRGVGNSRNSCSVSKQSAMSEPTWTKKKQRARDFNRKAKSIKSLAKMLKKSKEFQKI